MNIDMQELFAVFRAEAEECLAAMESGLLTLEQQPGDEGVINEVFRAAHTMKGNSSSLGFVELSKFAHAVEDLLDRVRSHELAADGGLITTLLRSADAMRAWVRGLIIGEDHPMDLAAREAFEAVQTFSQDPVAIAAAGPAAAAPTSAASVVASMMRIATAKLDALLTISGEVAVAAERVRRRVAAVVREDDQPVIDAIDDLQSLLHDLHESVMKSRLVAVGPAFRRHVRTVRDVAGAKGKQAQLVIEGEDVEVDVSVMEALSDPLTHMIRNAVDHGIEKPEQREAVGKHVAGRVLLRARHERGAIVITVSDDGRGVGRERLRERARDLGLSVDSMTDDEVLGLIFRPGFSTAETVSETSGRGVGMDVVRRNIERVRGHIAVQSVEGEGTTITLRLPLTLAVIPGFVVGVGGEQFVIPMAVVSEVVLLGDVPGGMDSGGVLHLRGEAVPYVRLRDYFGFGGAREGREVVVVVEHGDAHAGLVVDEVFGEAQTVVKPLGSALRNLPGVSGTAVLGDGGVTLVVESAAIFRDVQKPTAA